MISLEHMNNLQSPESTMAELKSHPELHRMMQPIVDAQGASIGTNILAFLELVVELTYFDEKVPIYSGSDTAIATKVSKRREKLLQLRVNLKSLLKKDTEIKQLEDFAVGVAKAAIHLSQNTKGIGWASDVVGLNFFP